MNKTPVSILQEMMVKNGTTPNYELIHDGGGTHVNTFTYRVTCDTLVATGTGRCKKDAKHEAAKSMLEAIAVHRNYPQLPASPAQSPVRTPISTVPTAAQRPSSNTPFQNSIGSLQDICAENNLQDPEYVAVSDIGPPHARVFTFQCVVSSFKETGVATTKKQAKQIAAKKMLDRINNLVKDLEFDAPLDENCQNRKQRQIIEDEIAKARYPELTIAKRNLGLKVSEYHSNLKSSLEEAISCSVVQQLKNLLDDINDDENIDKIDNFMVCLKDILLNINLDVRKSIIKCAKIENIAVMMCVNARPDLVEIGIGKDIREAEYSTIKKLIIILMSLLG